MRKVAISLATLLGTGVLAVGAVAVANDDDGSGRNGGQAQRLPGSDLDLDDRVLGSFHLKINRDEQSVDYTSRTGALSRRSLRRTSTSHSGRRTGASRSGSATLTRNVAPNVPPNFCCASLPTGIR